MPKIAVQKYRDFLAYERNIGFPSYRLIVFPVSKAFRVNLRTQDSKKLCLKARILGFDTSHDSAPFFFRKDVRHDLTIGEYDGLRMAWLKQHKSFQKLMPYQESNFRIWFVVGRI